MDNTRGHRSRKIFRSRRCDELSQEVGKNSGPKRLGCQDLIELQNCQSVPNSYIIHRRSFFRSVVIVDGTCI